jgi:hypothetical protein
MEGLKNERGDISRKEVVESNAEHYSLDDINGVEGLAPEQQEKLKEAFERLATIVQVVGGDIGMKVKIGTPGGGSFFDMKNITITLDPLHILEDENEAAFVAGHEGSHRAISRLATKFGYTSKQVNEQYKQIGFGYMHNAIEDPAVNDWMSGKFLGLKTLTQEQYDKQFVRENAELGTPEVVAVARRLGYWPKFAQFGSEVIRRWHQGRYSETLDPDVERALHITEAYSDESRRTIPPTQSWDERAIVRDAKKRFELNNAKVWPEVKRLVELDLKMEAGKQALEDLLKKAEERWEKRGQLENESDQTRREQLEKEIAELDKELKQFDKLKQEIEQAMKEMIERLEKTQKEARKDQNATDQEDNESQNEVDEEKDKQNENQGKGQESGEDQESESPSGSSGVPGSEEDSEGEEQSTPGGSPIGQGNQPGHGTPIGQGTAGGSSGGPGSFLSPFSPEEEKLLKEVEKSLPKELREKYREVAKKALEDLEDALNESMQGKLNEDYPKTHAEDRKEREIQERTAAERTRHEEQEQEIVRKLEERRLESMTAYERIRQSSKPIADYLFRNLMSILHPEETGGEETELPWGEKLDVARVVQAESDFRQKLKLWTREIAPEARDYAFQFCLDHSSSTSGIIEEEKIGLLAVSDALRRLEEHNTDKVKIRHSLSAFSDRYREYKNFKSRMNLKVAEEMSVISANGGTNTLEAVHQELERAFKEGAESGNFILIFSDGEPNHDIRKSLKTYLMQTKKRRQDEHVHVILVWIGDGTEKEELNTQCQALVEEYGFDAGLAMNAAEGEGGHHFGKGLSKLLKTIVESDRI